MVREKKKRKANAEADAIQVGGALERFAPCMVSHPSFLCPWFVSRFRQSNHSSATEEVKKKMC